MRLALAIRAFLSGDVLIQHHVSRIGSILAVVIKKQSLDAIGLKSFLVTRSKPVTIHRDPTGTTFSGNRNCALGIFFRARGSANFRNPDRFFLQPLSYRRRNLLYGKYGSSTGILPRLRQSKAAHY